MTRRWYWLTRPRRGLPSATCKLLRYDGFIYVGYLLDGEVWRDVLYGGGPLWLLSDNGGEINVEQLNRPETLVSVSVPDGLKPLTLGYRLAAAMRGRAIDYRFDADIDIAALGASEPALAGAKR